MQCRGISKGRRGAASQRESGFEIPYEPINSGTSQLASVAASAGRGEGLQDASARARLLDVLRVGPACDDERRDDYAMRALVDDVFDKVVCGRMTPEEASDQLDAAGVPFDVQCRVLCGVTTDIAA